MLIIFLVLALIHTLHGVPISSPTETSGSFVCLNVRDTQVQSGTRAVNDIILSCFATILACTWSALHPNIPAPTDCWWTDFKRRVVVMVYALLAPEAITAWALRQRMAAKTIADDYNEHMIARGKKVPDKEPNSIISSIRRLFQDSTLPSKQKEDELPRWTLAHGFFLQMGGFILCENRKPVQSLTSGDWNPMQTRIEWNIDDGIIDPPQITEEEIKDRSKGDAISKTFVILQTLWFVVQCLARWLQHLPVTELEVVTLGFALLNGVTYGLWWNKPQIVGQPVRLETKIRQQQPGDRPNLQKQYEDRPKSGGHISRPNFTHSNEQLPSVNEEEEALHLAWRQSLRPPVMDMAYRNELGPVFTSPEQLDDYVPTPNYSMPIRPRDNEFNPYYTKRRRYRKNTAEPTRSNTWPSPRQDIKPAFMLINQIANIPYMRSPPVPVSKIPNLPYVGPGPPPIPTGQIPNLPYIGSTLLRVPQMPKFENARPMESFWSYLLVVPLFIIKTLLDPLAKLVDLYSASVPSGALRVPMLYSGAADSSKIFRTTSAIGLLFGLVHLATSWFLEFPSAITSQLWRVAAIVMTVQPLFVALYGFNRHSKSKPRRDAFHALMVGGLLLYIAARVLLLTLSLFSLRSLPPGAFQTITWTVFIPHL